VGVGNPRADGSVLWDGRAGRGKCKAKVGVGNPRADGSVQLVTGWVGSAPVTPSQ
jgi:hypothetical protein